MPVLTIASVKDLTATPRLRVPSGTIKLTLQDGTAVLPAETVTVYVIEGGGGFQGPHGVESSQSLQTDSNGVVTIPDFVLGPEETPNRLLVQADSAHAIATILGSYKNTQIVAINPALGTQGGLCHTTTEFTVAIHDKNFPSALISDCPVMVEVSSGGGWVSVAGSVLRAALFESDANSQIKLTHQFSSREESSTIRVLLLESADVAPLVLTANARRPRLLSCGSSGRSETVAACSTNWWSMMVRMGSSDAPSDQVLDASVKSVQNIEILSRSKSGKADLFPPPGAPNFGSLLNATIRPAVAGDYSYEFWEPDYPDDPIRTVSGSAVDRQPGTALDPQGPDGGATYVQTFGGGTRDDAFGLEILPVAYTDAQIQTPNSPSQMFQIDIVLTPLSSGTRKIDEIDVKFKVHTTPGNSEKDDPASVGQTPGLVSDSPNGGDDFKIFPVTKTNGTTRLTAHLLSNQQNLDHVIEISARAKYQDLINGVWVSKEDATNILSRAVFFRPRVFFTRMDSNGTLVRIEDRGIVPATVVDSSGNAKAPEKDREVYLEFIAPHTGATIRAMVSCGNLSNKDIEFDELTPTGPGIVGYRQYRSKMPIVFYLESPDPFGKGSFALPATHYFVRMEAPYLVHANLIDPFPNNPDHVFYRTPDRPAAFLNLLPIFGSVQTRVPAPRIDVPDFNTAVDIHPVTRDKGDIVLKISGVIHDLVADQVPGGGAGISKMRINGVDVAVSADKEDASLLRPYAWKGTFDGRAKLLPGPNVIELAATNVLGATTTRTLLADLYDPRNDYSNPDVGPMQAQVRFGVEPDKRERPCMLLAHYRVPHVLAGLPPLAATASLTLVSVVDQPAGSVEDTVQLQINHINGNENTYVSQPVLMIPRSVPSATVQAARAAGVTLLYHTAGKRMRAWSDALPHPIGDQSFQFFTSSDGVDIRIRVNSGGSFFETDHVSPEDVFTVDAIQHDPWGTSSFELEIHACDRLGRPLPGSDSHLTLHLDKSPTSGDWSTLQGVAMQPPKLTDHLTAITLNADAPSDPNTVSLRVFGGGGLRIVRNLGEPVRLWPVTYDPQRQEAEGSAVPQESPRLNAAHAGVGVIVGTGELVLHESDAGLHGRGIDLRFVRTYRSFSDYDGPIGQNWTHNFNAWLRRVTDDQYLFVDGDGQTVAFNRRAPIGGTASSTFDPAPGFYMQLVEQSKRHCRVQSAGGIERVFIAQGAGDPKYLRLTTVFDRVRNRLGVQYSQTGVLANLGDAIGQDLYFRYAAVNGCIEAIGDSARRLWNYAFHDGKSADGANADLKSVTTPAVNIGPDPKPNGNQHTFAYEVAPRAAKRHKIKVYQDANGTASQGGPNPLPALLSINYDDNGRVGLQTLDLMQIVFTRNWPEIDLIDRGGHSKKFIFTGNVGDSTASIPQALVEVAAGVDYTTTLRYNSQFEADRVETPMSTVTEHQYADTDPDPRNHGNLLSTTRHPTPGRAPDVIQTVGITDFTVDPPILTPASLIWVYTYEQRFQGIKTSTDPRGTVTSYVYDYEIAGGREDGNVVEVHEPVVTSGVLGGGSQQCITRYQYNNFGQRVQELDPDFVITTLAYYAASSPGSGALVTDITQATGFLAQTIVDDTPANPNRSATLAGPQMSKETYTYDIFGERQWLTNGRGKKTLFTHNEIGELVETLHPDGGDERFFHDPNGRVIKHVELVKDKLPAGANPAADKTITDRHEYDRLGQHTLEVVDDGGLNLTTERKYDGNGNLEYLYTPASKPTGGDPDRFWKYVHDERDRRTQEISAPNVNPQWAVTYTYDDDGNALTRTDAQNLVETYVYNAWGHRIRIERAITLGLVLAPNSGKRYREEMCDALGEVVRVTVHGSITGNAGDDQDLGQQFVYYDEARRPVAVVDRVFRWVSLATGWTKTDVGSGRRIKKVEYDPAGHPAAVTGPRPARVTCLFSGHGHQTNVVDPQTGETTFAYDENQNLISVTYPGPALATGSQLITLKRTYDDMDRLATVETQGGTPVAYYYDTRGNMRLYVDPMGNQTFGEYDNAGRLTSAKREMRQGGRHYVRGTTTENTVTGTTETKHLYDENGNLRQVIYNNIATALSHSYGPHDERKSTTVADDALLSIGRDDNKGPETYSYEYLPNRLMDTITTPDNLVIKHEYNDGQLSRRTVAPKPGVTPVPVIAGTTEQLFTFDGAGRCVKMQDDNGVQGVYCTTRLRHDSLNNVWEDEQSDISTGSITAASEFSDAGDLSLMKYQQDTSSVLYITDPAGRLAIMSPFANYSWYPGRNFLNTRKYPNDLTLDLYFYADGRLQSHLHDLHGDPKTAIQGERVDAWNEAGMPEQVGDVSQNEVSINYYDSLHRLGVVHQGLDPSKPGTDPTRGVWTSFDDRGNIVTLESGSISGRTADGRFVVTATRDTKRSINLVNQLLQSVERVDAQGSAIAQTNVFHYDRRGNMISEPSFTYAYDVFNRLKTVTDQSGTVVANFMYDGLGRRLNKKTASDTTRFIYNGNRVIEELSSSSGDRKRYFYAAEGLIGYETQPSGAASLRYYVHEDRTGSAGCLTDANGKVVERYGYDPFGYPQVYDAAWNKLQGSATKGLPILNQGQYYDAETGLYCVGSRYYHPKLQRMLQRDPVWLDADTNAYTYAHGNLQAYRDPTGNFVFLLVAAGVGLVFGIGFYVAHQLAKYYIDGDTNAQITGEGLFWAGLGGAVSGVAAALLIWAIPCMAVVLPAVSIVAGVVGAVVDLSQGKKGAAVVDLGGALLAAAGLYAWARFVSPRYPNLSRIQRTFIAQRNLPPREALRMIRIQRIIQGRARQLGIPMSRIEVQSRVWYDEVGYTVIENGAPVKIKIATRPWKVGYRKEYPVEFHSIRETTRHSWINRGFRRLSAVLVHEAGHLVRGTHDGAGYDPTVVAGRIFSQEGRISSALYNHIMHHLFPPL